MDALPVAPGGHPAPRGHLDGERVVSSWIASRPTATEARISELAEELDTGELTADDLEAALSELIELESRIPVEERRAEAAARMAELEEVESELLVTLRALEEAHTDEAEKLGAGVVLRQTERNQAGRMERLRQGMRSETATEVETAIQGATSAATEARLALERVRAALEALRGAG